VVLGAGVRHLMLVGIQPGRTAAVATAAAALALAYLTAHPAAFPLRSSPEGTESGIATPSFVTVRTIIVQRCAVCHSETPTVIGVGTAPRGVALDTPEQIKALAALIKAVAVDQKTMPPDNRTRITDEERAVLGRWVDAGGPLR
jgi:uncharacterized membrane protein